MNHSKILKEIENYGTIVIHTHQRPDPDALGSQLGLKKILELSFPEKKIYAVGETIEKLSFIPKLDLIEDNVFADALSIVLDTANESRVSDKRFNLAEKVVKIDHHPDREPFGNLSWVDTNFSSTSEMIYEFFNEFDDTLKLDKNGALLLYFGIVGDTGRFLYNNTSCKTHKYAGYLLEYDVNPQVIYDELYKTSSEVARLHGSILLNFKVSEHGVAYYDLTTELLNQFNVSQNDGANLVNVLANIEGNNIWVFFVESEDEIRVRIRSKSTPINEFAQKYNGGGHPLASGATVQTWEEARSLISDLDELLSTL
jgi:phosphoesterase RecJ-like protein